MPSAGLANAAEDRKARLAALKSLKRKQPDSEQDADQDANPNAPSDQLPPPPKSPNRLETTSPAAAPTYLSGRNYDPETRGPKLGFEFNPAENQDTLERKAAQIAEEARLQAQQDAADEAKPLDLFKLQPKKPNWDLKRDLDRKLDVLNVRTENAIARLVRERIAAQQAAKKVSSSAAGTAVPAAKNGDGEVQELGMDGSVFVEATREREREDEEDARRERELDDQLLDAS